MSAEGISSQVRRIAILVTSLDASAGRQLLMAMPADLARQVRRAMTQLGHVDPEEQRQILAEFRMQAIVASDSQPPTSHQRHSQTASNPLPKSSGDIDDSHSPHAQTAEIPGHAATPLAASGFKPKEVGTEAGIALSTSGVAKFDVHTLSELLRGERATVVAVVLSQLDPRQGADLLGKLPKALQREAIVSLSRIGQIDPVAMQAIDEHLASRIADYHHRQAGENESTGRIQELLAAAAPELRSDWQSTLAQSEPLLASKLGIAAPMAAKADENRVRREPGLAPGSGADRHQSRLNSSTNEAAKMLEMLANNVVTTADQPVATSATKSTPASLPSVAPTAAHRTPVSEAADDQPRILPFPTKATQAASIRFEQILDLPAEEIGRILAAAETDVILYALAGASPAFMKRFMAMLDRADGRALQARLKQIRAINLKDVDAAQRRLCELASATSLAKAA